MRLHRGGTKGVFGPVVAGCESGVCLVSGQIQPFEVGRKQSDYNQRGTEVRCSWDTPDVRGILSLPPGIRITPAQNQRSRLPAMVCFGAASACFVSEPLGRCGHRCGFVAGCGCGCYGRVRQVGGDPPPAAQPEVRREDRAQLHGIPDAFRNGPDCGGGDLSAPARDPGRAFPDFAERHPGLGSWAG